MTVIRAKLWSLVGSSENRDEANKKVKKVNTRGLEDLFEINFVTFVFALRLRFSLTL